MGAEKYVFVADRERERGVREIEMDRERNRERGRGVREGKVLSLNFAIQKPFCLKQYSGESVVTVENIYG